MKKLLCKLLQLLFIFILFTYFLIIINFKYNNKLYNKKSEIKILNNTVKENYCNILRIDKINLYLNVVKATNNYSNLDNNLVYYKSFNPYNKIIIFGHSGLGYGSYFNRIDELDIGDEANIYTQDRCFIYSLYSKYYINEDKIDLLNEENNSNKLLLITCKKNDNTKRLVLEFHKKS